MPIFDKELEECENCGNTNEGDTVFRCKNCGALYCSDCLPQDSCNECGEEWFMTALQAVPGIPGANLSSIGYIKGPVEDND